MPNALQKKGCRLGQLNLTDLPAVLTLLAEPGLAQAAGLQLAADDSLRQWAISNWLSQHYLWGIFKGKQLIGLMALFPVNEQVKELGYLLAKPFRQQGIMTAALHELLMQTTGITIIAETKFNNYPSIAILRANGFTIREQDANQLRWQLLTE